MALDHLDSQHVTILCSSLLQAGHRNCHVIEAAHAGGCAAASVRGGTRQAACRSLHQGVRDTKDVGCQASCIRKGINTRGKEAQGVRNPLLA